MARGALDAHARDELGISGLSAAKPLQAALAGLFFGLSGLIGAVTLYLTIHAVDSKLPTSLVVVAALAAAVLSFLAAQVALGNR